MISKTTQLDDYKALRDGGGLSPYVKAWARCRGAFFDVYEPHEHRAWEYGSALTAALQHFPSLEGKRVHNIGSGYTAFGVALKSLGFNVCESDPDRRVVDALLPLAQWADYRAFQWDLTAEVEAGPPFDLVTCISTVEHIPAEGQERAWENLEAMVAPGGLLVVTTDVSPHWKEGRERASHFTMEDVAHRVEWLQRRSFHIEADLTYHGDEVYDYSFFRFVATR